MADSDPRIPPNLDTNIRGNMPAIALGSAQVVFIGTNPHKPAAVAVDKNGENATVFLTTDCKNSDGTKLTSLSNSGIIWNEVSASGTTNYFAGDSTLVSGIKIEGSPSSSAIQYSVTQRGKG